MMAGDTFGRWEVLGPAGMQTLPNGTRRSLWLCRCVCGTERPVFRQNLINGRSVSCGCYSKERATKHGEYGTPEYRAWSQMMQRCYNEKNPRYGDYGGRGILVSDEWRHSFQTFLADMGMRPSPQHSIDRKDNDGNYCRDNCKWSLPVEQMNNRRVTRK